MSQKQIEIRILKDGTVKSRTKGMLGKSCMKYVKAIEELTAARAIDSEFTQEYYLNEQSIQEANTVVEEEQESIQYNKENTSI